MKDKRFSEWTFKVLIACAVIGCAGMSNVGRAQTAPADLSPDVQEVLTLSRQHMDDSVITNYIMSTGRSYKLSSDDIIYLNSQGVSQPVISALLQTSANSAGLQPATPAAPATTPAPTASSAPATPPPPDESSAPSGPGPSVVTPATPAPMAYSAPPPMSAGLLDNFFTDGGLNAALWQTQSPILTSLAAANRGALVTPGLSFSPSGVEMSGIRGGKQFMGVQSTMAFAAPFSFSATVTGLAQDAIPFEIYFVSGDMRQWLSVAGHLGGRPHPPHGAVTFWGPLGGVRVPVGGGGPSADYGVWVNHTGNGQPISALGNKLFDHPFAGLPYTIQVSVGADGLAAVTLLDANHIVLAAESVPAGTGPFYVVLAGRNGTTYAEWQSVQLSSSGPSMAVAEPEPAVAVPPTPTTDYFQAQLAPYGTWAEVPGYGLCWQPAIDPGWRPYYDGGHWEYTDAGWFWQSDYPWGDIAFHYGRWAYTVGGWVWVPGYDYAPAWVVWRHDDADGYVGWAPLPPGAVFVDGGWVFNGRHVGVDFDFGLGVGFFNFVGYDHFWEHNFRPWIVPHDRVVFAFGHSAIVNHYAFEHGRFVDEGLARDRMETFTHHDFRPVPIGDLRHDEEMHHAMERHDDIHNFHPGTPPDARGGWGQRPNNGQNGGQHQNYSGHQQNNQGHQGQNGWGH